MVGTWNMMKLQVSKPLCVPKTIIGHFPFPSPPFPLIEHVSGTKSLSRNHKILKIELEISCCRASSPASDSTTAPVNAEDEEDPESSKLKDAEREQINKSEEPERKANLQLERLLVMASCWIRTLLTMRWKLKGTRAKFISAEATSVTFDDFAGQDHIKRELQEVVRILMNDEEFKDRGIYCPKGVLYGPPGTGKTLLAKAIAGESGLPFFAANGTEFVEMNQGGVASRVKDLFNTARSHAPSIIFIDEIDAIGSKPGGGPDIGKGSAESEQGLLQILAEMDGFKVDTSRVLVIGVTNRLDILDPALLRKGRFDKIIRVGLPIRDGRLAILKVRARNKNFRSEEEKEVLLEEIADLTEDFTGAELQNILNEAGILTTRKDLDFIGRDELLEALKRQKGTFETGQEDITEIPEDLKLRMAYREAAVAVLACYFPDPNRSIIETHINSIRSEPNLRFAKARGKVFPKKSDYVNSIVCACAPLAIEEEIFGVDDVCWMYEKAILKASRLAETLILRTGMTAFGKAYYRKKHNDLLPNLAPKLQALRDEYIRFAMEKCSSVLREYDSAVEKITDTLLDKGKIDAEEIWDTYRSAPRIPQPPVTPVDEYGALVYAGRWGIHGVSLPGRVTFAPGNVGFATFGAPRPMQEMRAEASMKNEEDK